MKARGTPDWYYSLPPFRSAFAQGLPALMYHHVLRPPRDSRRRGLFVSPSLFQQQMGELHEAGFTTVMPDQVAGQKAGQVLLTFDDGFANVLTHALPALIQYKFQSVQFIVADLIGSVNRWDAVARERQDPLMNQSQIREWLAAGQHIGSHSRTHPHLTQISVKQMRSEIFDSKKILEDRFGVAIEHFCYPYGDFNPSLRDLVQEAGYRTACTTEAGINDANTNRWQLKRFLVRHHRPGLLALAPFLPSRWF